MEHLQRVPQQRVLIRIARLRRRLTRREQPAMSEYVSLGRPVVPDE